MFLLFSERLFFDFIRVTEDVAAAPDGFNVIFAARGFFKLLSQFADEDVDNLQFRFVNAAVQMVQKLVFVQG